MPPTPAHSSYRFGVNYVPSKRWWYCWNDFEKDSIARDLDVIAELGADHIRIMCIWPFFQPNRRGVSEAHLDRLEELMLLAAERKLDVCPAMLTGWLSGWAFMPSYIAPEGLYTSNLWFRDPVERYFRAAAARLNKHKNFFGFDLGNEINCCWKTDNLDDGDGWMDWIMDLCQTLSPRAVHVNGVDHTPWFTPHTFSATKLAKRQQLIAIHSWIEFTGASRLGGVLHPVCTKLAPAMAALVRAYAGDPNKPVWLQEFGASVQWMDKDDIPKFLEASTHASVAGGICTMTWWASHDLSPAYEFAELEYDLGLIDTHNKIKPNGQAFQRMAKEYRGKPVKIPKLKLPAPPKFPVDATRDENQAATWKWLREVQAQLP